MTTELEQDQHNEAIGEEDERIPAPWQESTDRVAAAYDHADGPEHAVESPQAPAVQGGWVLKVTPKHSCIRPAIDNRTFVGSIWRCGECGQHWMVYERRGQHVGTKAFKRITEEAAAKQLGKHPSDQG